MRIGLFGGSFDPVHYGHIRPVQAARRALRLDRVLYLPTARPPHKSERAFAPAHARYTMVEMALLREEGLFASDHELTLERSAYTVETVAHFREALPGAEFYLILGADAFVDLHHWHNWRELTSGVEMGVLVRPRWNLTGPSDELPPEIAGLARSGRVHFVENPPVEASSTELRALFARGEIPSPELIPPIVLDYIRKYSLYQ